MNNRGQIAAIFKLLTARESHLAAALKPRTDNRPLKGGKMAPGRKK